jgi:hypothetical protein
MYIMISFNATFISFNELMTSIYADRSGRFPSGCLISCDGIHPASIPFGIERLHRPVPSS